MKKIIIKVIILAILSVLFLGFLESPVISNELAMTQFENDNVVYTIVSQIKPVVKTIYNLIMASFVAWISHDIYKIIKEKKVNEEV